MHLPGISATEAALREQVADLQKRLAEAQKAHIKTLNDSTAHIKTLNDIIDESVEDPHGGTE